MGFAEKPSTTPSRERGRWMVRLAAFVYLCVVAAWAALTYMVPDVRVCHPQMTPDGSVVPVCGPIGANDALLVGLLLLPAVVALLGTDLSEVGIAGLLTMKRQVQAVERRQDRLEQILTMTQMNQQSQDVKQTVAVLNVPVERLREELARQIEGQSTISTGELSVESDNLARLQVLGESLVRTSLPNLLADQLVTGVTSAGRLKPGSYGQAGNIELTLKKPLSPGRRTLSVTLETPGVTFAGTPILTFNMAYGGNASATRENDRTLILTLVGPSQGPVVAVLSGIVYAVDPDVPAGTVVNVSVSIDGGPPQGLATVATVAPPMDADVLAAATPTMFVGAREQATGLVSIIERGSGELGGSGRYPILRLRFVNDWGVPSRSTFSRPPWIVVRDGDLRFESGTPQLAGTTVSGAISGNASECEWSIYSPSTVRSVLEFRGSDLTGLSLPSGATNGPRVDVEPGERPGTPLFAEIEMLDADRTRALLLSRVAVGNVVESKGIRLIEPAS